MSNALSARSMLLALALTSPASPQFIAPNQPPGADDAILSSGRAAAKRTAYAFARIELTPLYESEPETPGGNYPDEDDAPPQLEIDSGGFSGGSINALAFSPDGRMLAAAGDVVRIWNLSTGELVHTLRGQRGFGRSSGCTDMTFTPDGRSLLVAVSGFQASLRIYTLAGTPQIEDVLGGHDGHIDRVAVSPDGKWFVTSGIDNILHVWSWDRRQKVHSFRLQERLLTFA